MLQMFNHGISSAALFFLVGVIYERTHTRKLDDYGGLRKIMPIYAGMLGISMFSSLGSARAERVCRRIPDFQRRVSDRHAGHVAGDDRAGRHGGVPAWA